MVADRAAGDNGQIVERRHSSLDLAESTQSEDAASSLAQGKGDDIAAAAVSGGDETPVPGQPGGLEDSLDEKTARGQDDSHDDSHDDESGCGRQDDGGAMKEAGRQRPGQLQQNQQSQQSQKHPKNRSDDGYGCDEEEEDDGMPPLANEPSAGFQAAEIQVMQASRAAAAATAAAGGSGGAAARSSRPSSAHSRPLTIVPRSQRRGLFGKWAILPEVERPYDYTNKTKWIITAIISLSAAGGPLGSSIFYPALSEMAIDLHASPTVTNLTVAMYMLSMSIFPLWWSSFSESMGRRSVYVISFSFFVVFSVLSAVSRSISMLIVMRILAGGASASVQAVGAGTLADIWEPRERGRAMGIFYLGPLTGPLFAPIIGGALAQHWGWQSTMWFLTIFGGLTLLMLFFCLPETLPRRSPPAGSGAADAGSAGGDAPLARMSTTRSSVRQRTRHLAGFLLAAFIYPLSVVLYLRFPPILLTVVYGSVTFGSLFVLNVTIQSAFSSPPYNFGELVVGLLYIPCSLGYVVGSVVGGRWIDRIMAREARKAGRYDEHGGLVFLPEDRMRENAWLAASMFPAALVWFGWTTQNGVLWVAPAVANAIFGFGSMLVFGVVTTMLTEFMPRRSSGGIALNNFLRNIFSCTGAIVAQPLIDAMGVGWVCTMVALLSFFVGNACIWALRRYGERWRATMDRELNKMT